ncbi:hypothetical protein O3P69_015103 [Scylla paramamosain]|uniref:Uncharacterized protein n=1 Tax=Scylla paramamosain TaxID=85552 RepID=A0AAW0T2K5_SCYPA
MNVKSVTVKNSSKSQEFIGRVVREAAGREGRREGGGVSGRRESVCVVAPRCLHLRGSRGCQRAAASRTLPGLSSAPSRSELVDSHAARVTSVQPG